jgi:hypothetical protein
LRYERLFNGCGNDCGGFASEKISEKRRVDLDTTVAVMAMTAKEMNSKYKETSERQPGRVISALFANRPESTKDAVWIAQWPPPYIL